MAPRKRSEPAFDTAHLADMTYQLRHQNRWSQEELGSRAQVHPVTISKIERQALPSVSADTVVRLAVALDVSIGTLLSLQPNTPLQRVY